MHSKGAIQRSSGILKYRWVFPLNSQKRTLTYANTEKFQNIFNNLNEYTNIWNGDVNHFTTRMDLFYFQTFYSRINQLLVKWLTSMSIVFLMILYSNFIHGAWVFLLFYIILTWVSIVNPSKHNFIFATDKKNNNEL